MDTTAANCGFILTANFKKKVIEALWSRCSIVEFELTKDEKAKMALQFHNRLKMILEKEQKVYKAAALPPIVMKFLPDFRRCLNEVQRYSATGMIDEGLLTSLKEASIVEAMNFMMQKNFTALRKWCAENADMDYNEAFSALYKSANLFQPNSIPALVVILGEYQYKHAFVANPEINMAACLAQIMLECEFK
jgi:DNA polymerase III delta prime subunit